MQNIFLNYIHLLLVCLVILALQGPQRVQCSQYYTKEKKLELREQVRSVFQHGYDSYLRYAADYDELRPLTCDGVDTWGSYSLTLIDALDTLATMGNYSEFRRIALLIEKKMNFDKDINVSVFETNIRIVGGLISAHLISKKAGLNVEKGWPCQGPLLRLAEDVAKRLLPAFDTFTGMPYGTVNLRYGVPKGETPITCTAAVGTFLIEFGALSRLTGNPIYEEVALNAIHTIWERRSPLGLVGNHIDVLTGRWTALDSGIGAGVDSLFEYLVKGAIMLNRPELLEMFHEARHAIDKYQRRDDWYVWVHMAKGQVTLPVFQSLESFWPGILSLIGDIRPAVRTFAKYYSVLKKYGFLPEFFNIPLGEASQNRESYPLRPELVESAMYLYRATNDHVYLEMGETLLKSIEFSAKTKCGYSTIRNVVTHEKENRMESFFLAETTKYLYLLFDEENFLHNDGVTGERLETTNGECVVYAGSYIFNTEAHPIDMSALHCCHDIKSDIYEGLDLEMFSDNNLLKTERERRIADETKNKKYQCAEGFEDMQKHKNKLNTTNSDQNDTTATVVDIMVYDENNNKAADVLIDRFDKVKNQRRKEEKDATTINLLRNQLTVADLDEFFDKKRSDFKSARAALDYVVRFMKNFTLDASFIVGLEIFDKNVSNILGFGVQKDFESTMRTLWEIYELKQRYAVNVKLAIDEGLTSYDDDKYEKLTNLLQVLDYETTKYSTSISLEEEAFKTKLETLNNLRLEFQLTLVNTTSMQEFLLKVLIKGTNDKNRTYTKILDESDIKTLKPPTLSPKDRVELFEYIQKNAAFKKRMIETFRKLQTLMKEEKALPPLPESAESETNDELIVATDQPKRPKLKQGDLLAPEFRTIDNSEINFNTENIVAETTEVSENNDSVWSQLVQTFLKKTTPQPIKFDEGMLLEKTRLSLQKFIAKPVNYEVLTCQRPTFIENFAYRSFYP
ncbi:ER degradation-enhancing alpha-mannosidase-like protein 2 [Teleopsis dalmanni]|uniref:ER degradation-enhancing alpha-mannosidase-like protein 2 n=1 Tax=Teleopsis dalmanni TaxID=139649 RepID=UPI0018CF375E|nr:ER degradation-enhancing alpha-mannosidase-like protein 2 [Teleopsis dalmanni]XP_037938055.1 ER degradation-enhancing alpha-mannosidase-like protein 2 [Teleopsis dalmanni]